MTMSSIVEELRTSKRQLVMETTFDASRRRRSRPTNAAVADNNNNNYNYNTLLMSSQTENIGLWSRGWRPTSSAAQRRTGQTRPKRRRGRAEPRYDEYGALDLTSANKVGRTSSTAARQQSVLLPSATVNLVTDDSVPLDLSVLSRRLPYVHTRQRYTA